ncbi:MAG TPA: ABC transporter ATP-binding protein [Thermoanaerobaculia bacterium]|nr:ABC transporter ATP-binding protein [Thermoanaerobaculia bacterium]
MSVLGLDGVDVVREGRTILSLPHLDVCEKEILAVLGPTGAGKSTLLRVLHFLERPDAGSLSWRGERVPWPAPLELRRRISMAFQDPLLLSGTTYDNVEYGLSLRGQNGSGARERVTAMLRLFHIEHLASQRARTLSGGEAQRTALARALVVSPELLLLDEPFAALDAPIRKHLLDELRQVVRAHGITCVYVTHEQSEAFAIADRIAVLRHGKLLQAGTPEEVLFRPVSHAVARFMQTGNIFPGVVTRRQEALSEVSVGERLLFSRTGLPEGTLVEACIRREEILVEAPGEASPAPGLNRFRGTVESVVDLGSTMQVRIEAGFPGFLLQALITRRVAHDLSPRPGVEVVATFSAASVHLIAREGKDTDDDL